MDANSSFGSLRCPEVFSISTSSPTPLGSPSTSYLTTIPRLPQTPPRPSREQKWQRLESSPSRSSMSDAIDVPYPPAPRSPGWRNDTPTPEMSTPGSWRGRRRHGEFVSRPLEGPVPTLRVNLPDDVSSISPDVPSIQSRDLGSLEEEFYTSAPESQGSAGTSTSLGSPKQQDAQGLTSPNTSVQTPPPAKLASHPNQLDGAPEEVATKDTLRDRSCCKKLCRSLRSIPSKLNLTITKEKRERGNNSPDDLLPSRPLAGTKGNTSWWSKASLRLRMPGRNLRRAADRSVYDVSSGSGTTPRTSGQSSTTGSHETRFDNPHAPQAFGAPVHEEDTDSPTEDPFPAEEEATGVEVV
ncbi:MAG: hypothetical protein Q9166_003818 [cf. Caloplaca sp. 2 TL-2023]